eukprot:COSAG04_NODE_2910_length_3395_cov_1.852852_3_plen_71_part_00
MPRATELEQVGTRPKEQARAAGTSLRSERPVGPSAEPSAHATYAKALTARTFLESSLIAELEQLERKADR